MSDLPAVSFLMPIAAPAPFLVEALESILAQTVRTWELVAVLDGAADSDVERALARMPARRTTVIRRASRGGISAALNLGLRHCRSPLVARLDADDVAMPNRLEIQLHHAALWPDVSILGGSAQLIDENGRNIGRLAMPSGRDIRRALLVRNRVIHSSALFRVNAVREVGGYNPSCHLREDYELWLRLAARAAVGNVDATVVKYRVSLGQTSRGRTTVEALSSVGIARAAAASAVGVPGWKTAAYHELWKLAQTGHVPRLPSANGLFRR